MKKIYNNFTLILILICFFINSLLFWGIFNHLDICNDEYGLKNTQKQNQLQFPENNDLEILNKEDSTPEIILEGSPEEIGHLYGVYFKDIINRRVLDFLNLANDKQYSRSDLIQMINQRKNVIQKYAPNLLNEWKATAKACNIDLNDYLALNLIRELDEESRMMKQECTSWIATGTATESGQTIHHKNCDSTRNEHAVVQIKQENKYGFTCIVETSILDVRAGINDQGVSITNNYVFVAQINMFGLPTNTINRLILENCNSVNSAYEYINTHPRQEGAIFIIGDKDRGAVIESSPMGISSYEDSIIENGIGYRANHFTILEGSQPLETSIRRYEDARDFLQPKIGSLTIKDFNELSRHHYHPDNSTIIEHDSSDGSICNYHTVFGATFQINKEHPEELSVMWAALAAPCSSIYAPFHVFSNDVYEPYVNGKAWEISETSYQNNLGPPCGLIPELLEFEEALISQSILKEQEISALIGNNNVNSLKEALSEFDLQIGELVLNKLTYMANNTIWKDSFYCTSGLTTVSNVQISDNYLTLKPNENEGKIRSITIKTKENGFNDAIFQANHYLPSGSDISYYIIDDETKEILLSISSQQASEGYSLSALNSNEIILKAILTKGARGSPIMNEWCISNLLTLDEMTTSEVNRSANSYFVLILSFSLIGILIISIFIVLGSRIQRRQSIGGEKKSEGIQYGGFTIRLGAYIIDSFTYCIAFFFLYTLAVNIVGILPVTFSLNLYTTIGLLLISFFVGFFIYFWSFETLSNGKTIGKWLFNLKTVAMDSHEPLSAKDNIIVNFTKGNFLLIIDVLIGLLKNYKQSKNSIRYSQNISKSIIIKTNDKSSFKLYMFPILGVIFSISGLLIPAAYIFDLVTINVWIIGLISPNAFISAPNYGMLLITCLICSLLFISMCLIIVLVIYKLKQKDFQMKRAKLIFMVIGIAQMFLLFIWMILFQNLFTVLTEGAFRNFNFWEIFLPGFGLFNFFFGTAFYIIGSLVKPS